MSIEFLLNLMSSLLNFGGKWHARANGSSKFFTGPTPRAAMEQALADLEDEL